MQPCKQGFAAWGRALGLAALIGWASAAHTQEKVAYNMAWLPQGSSVGVIVAQELGYFKEAGLDVSIQRGYGGNRTANELDQGQYEFGYVDPISLVLNRSNGGKIRMVGALNTRWPAGICFDTRRHKPKSPADMKGLTLGGGSASPVHNVVPAWLELNGQPRDSIRLLRMDPAVVDASLIEGRIDLAECWRASNRAVTQKQADAAGVPLGWIEYGDFGLDAYGSGFAASEDTIRKRPDMVRKFLKASYRGYEYAFANPERAADLMVKMFPVTDRGVALAQIRDMADLLVDPQARDKGLGYLRDDRMRSTVQFVDKAFGLNGKVKPQDTYTNDLLK
ncbi:ABC transporter substrate-binding protein [Pigmentiphaga kullae]|uniref:Thiamine pyrimidine synthase n=1 Tax=Pigmentiphaga kullae TaxID=151784 RepID=A0A4Q7NBC0_9BURK|nr:ABC transporter substrate-binding protein [Pigmentiphaga kullae]RZS80288.1 NitT/TauT family transport system substrate-binding protein [Pigmentiphaga kullae]